MRVLTVVMIFSLPLPCAVQFAAAQDKEAVYGGKPVSEWIARLKDKDDKVRLKAAFSLRQLGPEAKPAVPALMDSLKDKNASVRQESAFALLRIGAAAKPAIPALTQSLQDEDFYVRFWSLIALADFGADARAAAPALAQILKDPDTVLRAQAARGLWLMGEKKGEALAVLIDLLQNKKGSDVSSAAFVLAEIGDPEAKPAVPGLLKVLERPRPTSLRCGDLDDRQLGIDHALKEALKKIDPAAVKKVDMP